MERTDMPEIILPKRRLRGAGYYRKSNDDGGESVSQQQAWARGLQTDPSIDLVKEFTDQATSGLRTRDRKGLEALVAYCQEQHRLGCPIDVVVVWNTNRFSRAGSIETAVELHKLIEAGVRYIYANAKGFIDLHDEKQVAVFNIEQTFTNNAYSRQLAETATRGRAKAARAGKPSGAPAPYGYRSTHFLDSKGKRQTGPFVVYEQEAQWIRWLFQEYATTDTSCRALAFRLNDMKIPTPQGCLWDARAVGRLFRQKKYLGLMPWGKEIWGQLFFVADVADGKIEEQKAPGKRRQRDPEEVWTPQGEQQPIITDRALWERVQAKLDKEPPVKRGGGRRSGNRSSLLSGLLVCGHCQREMIVRTERSKKDKTSKRTSYVCATYWHHGSAACNLNRIWEDDMVQALGKKLHAALSDPERQARLREIIHAQESANGVDPASVARGLREQVEALEGKIDRNMGRMMDETDDKIAARYHQAIVELQAEQADLRRRLAEMERAAGNRIDVEARVAQAMTMLERLGTLLVAGEPAEVRALLQEMLSKIVVFFDNRMVIKQRRNTFARGMVYLRPDFFLGYSLDPCHQWHASPLELPLTPADLAA
jgi:site-specific DNA recombinase